MQARSFAALRMTVIAVVPLLIGGCSLWYGLYDRERPVIVTELQIFPSCGPTDQAAPVQVHYFESASAVTTWEQGRGLALSAIDESIEGPFALIEPGAPSEAGNSLVISRDAIVHSGGRLVLAGTIFTGLTTDAAPNACTLLALPPQHYSRIELYDQLGALRAETSTKEGDTP
jgi:hypothetical protein